MRILALHIAIVIAALTPTLSAADPPTTQPQDVPLIVPDPTIDDWVVDRFAGNTTAGPIVFQGPAIQMGGAGRSTSLAVAPDGRAWFPVADGIMEVSTSGVARLVVSRQEWKADGLDDLYGRGGLLAWNPKEECLYFWGKSCIRKLVQSPDGGRRVETVVGDPKRPGTDDGPAAKATLSSVGNICISTRGTVYFYDARKSYGDCLRKLENGTVSTITDRMRTGKLVDGPLDEACFNFINLGGLNSVGETDDVLYIADHWNFAIRRIDLRAGQVTTVAGMRRPDKGSPLADRFGKHADGPALTHASCNSGCVFAVYDRVHGALWMGGPDEQRLRWLKDSQVRTIVGSKPGNWDLDGSGTPAANVKMTWCWVVAVDGLGRAYVMNGASKTGYWRLHNRKEVAR